MLQDGGKETYTNNKAGAKYGTGYCDAQCPNDIKFINGEANSLDGSDFTNGGHYGSCCAEFDLWEANSIASAYTSHTCTDKGSYRCEGEVNTLVHYYTYSCRSSHAFNSFPHRNATLSAINSAVT